MRVLFISIILVISSTLLAQQSSGKSTTNKQLAEQTAKSEQNIIDFKNPAQKVKPVRMENPEGSLKRQNRQMGSSQTSGPAERLEKKENVQSEVTNKELQIHLKTTKVLHPIKKQKSD